MYFPSREDRPCDPTPRRTRTRVLTLGAQAAQLSLNTYWPDKEIVDGSWQPPGIERVNSSRPGRPLGISTKASP